ncbi:MAG: cell wall metabolism sensor histidine kinase WalK [Firmicutes bacterium]|jgi:PAS domain S-box-containing protein|nr:cell wall metabolism sensor histidine kinase WalK [Bacillota bacterium]
MLNESKDDIHGKAILDILPDPLILTDSKGCIEWLNRKAEKVFHLSRTEVQGTKFNEAIKIYKIANLVEEVLISGEPSGSSYETATIRLEDRNIEYFFKISVNPVFENGKLSGALVLLSDVSRFGELEKIKANFVSIVSHEFRTPLASIAIGVGMLKEGLLGELNEKGRQIVGAIEEDCDRLDNLVNNLLELSRMESGRINIEKEAVDPRELVEEAIRLLALQAEAKKITITADLPSQLPPVEADFNKIIWLLTNLIGNALRYTPEGGNIKIKAKKPSGNRMFISVIDTGCGIPRLYQKKIFKKFVQVKNGEAPAGGSGLGLAICQEVVEAHGGRIWVESVEGQGSTFTFSLPLSAKEKL